MSMEVTEIYMVTFLTGQSYEMCGITFDHSCVAVVNATICEVRQLFPERHEIFTHQDWDGAFIQSRVRGYVHVTPDMFKEIRSEN